MSTPERSPARTGNASASTESQGLASLKIAFSRAQSESRPAIATEAREESAEEQALAKEMAAARDANAARIAATRRRRIAAARAQRIASEAADAAQAAARAQLVEALAARRRLRAERAAVLGANARRFAEEKAQRETIARRVAEEATERAAAERAEAERTLAQLLRRKEIRDQAARQVLEARIAAVGKSGADVVGAGLEPDPAPGLAPSSVPARAATGRAWLYAAIAGAAAFGSIAALPHVVRESAPVAAVAPPLPSWNIAVPTAPAEPRGESLKFSYTLQDTRSE